MLAKIAFATNCIVYLHLFLVISKMVGWIIVTIAILQAWTGLWTIGKTEVPSYPANLHLIMTITHLEALVALQGNNKISNT